MYRNLPKGLISKLENPDLEFYFYFSLNTTEIIKKLESENSPLKFLYNQEQIRIYNIEDFKYNEFCLMNNQEDWIYQDNKIKNRIIKKYNLIPESVLTYQCQNECQNIVLTKLIGDYLIKQKLKFFTIGYNISDEKGDIPIFVNN